MKNVGYEVSTGAEESKLAMFGLKNVGLPRISQRRADSPLPRTVANNPAGREKKGKENCKFRA